MHALPQPVHLLGPGNQEHLVLDWRPGTCRHLSQEDEYVQQGITKQVEGASKHSLSQSLPPWCHDVEAVSRSVCIRAHKLPVVSTCRGMKGLVVALLLL